MAEESRLRRLLRIPLPARQQASADLRAELELHLELRARELEEEGWPPERAREEALRLFGDPERVRREMLRTATRNVREQRGREAVWNMFRDVRYAGRSLLRSPAFTAVAVATLAIGIGANTAMFSVVDAVLLEPLPVPQPDRVAMVYETREGVPRNPGNPANFVAWRERAESFESMAAMYTIPVTVLSDGDARQVPMQLAHPDLFRVLKVAPRLGRVFAPEEGAASPGEAQVVVLSDGFWREQFGGDPEVIGKPVELVGGRAEVVGVMGPELDFFAPDVAFWMPTDYAWGNRTSMGRFTRVVARLAPGATMGSAQAEMDRIMAGLREEDPDFNSRWEASVVPLDEVVKGDVRPALLVLLGAVGVLLLVTCVNVANLMMVRAASRRTEMAVRASLGAGRGRIIRELLTESLLLSVVGGALGLVVAYLATQVLVTTLPAALDVPRLTEAGVDVGVLAFAALIAVATGVIFGLAPAFDAFRTDLVGQLREGGRGGGGGRRGHRVRSAIVVAQVALSLVLLIGAGLLLRSFVQLQRTDLGLQPENVVTARITMQGERYAEGEARATLLRQVISSVVSLPDVRTAGAIAWLPLTGLWSGHGFYLPGQEKPISSDLLPTEVQAVAGDAFTALGIPLLRGRTFTEADRPGAPLVVVVNEALAERTWPGENPIGKRLILPWGTDDLLEVVGVVANVRQRGVEQEAAPGLYRPYAQFPAFGSVTLAVRTGGADPGALAGQLATRVREIDPHMALAQLTTMEDVVADAIARPRLTSFAVAAFAGLALLLAALGIYGVLAYAVSLRNQELGVRQALGARAADVARLVLRDALVLAGIGVAVGVALAAVGTRILAAQLYQVSPRDPAVFLGMPLLLVGIALLAAVIPAIRAARVRPALAVRDE